MPYSTIPQPWPAPQPMQRPEVTMPPGIATDIGVPDARMRLASAIMGRGGMQPPQPGLPPPTGLKAGGTFEPGKPAPPGLGGPTPPIKPAMTPDTRPPIGGPPPLPGAAPMGGPSMQRPRPMRPGGGMFGRPMKPPVV